MSKKSLTKRVFWSKVIPGIAWIIVGACKMFTTILVVDIIGLMANLVAMLGLVSVLRGKYEDPDEMAVNAMRAAESNAFYLLYLILIIIASILSFPAILHTMAIDMSLIVAVAYVIAGIGFISTGLFFFKYDKEGDF